VAAGEDGTLLVSRGGGWVAAPPPTQAGVPRRGSSFVDFPSLYAAATAADGTVLVGG